MATVLIFAACIAQAGAQESAGGPRISRASPTENPARASRFSAKPGNVGTATAAVALWGSCEESLLDAGAQSTCENVAGNKHKFLANCCLCLSEFNDCYKCPGGTYTGCSTHGTIAGSCSANHDECDGEATLSTAEVELLLRLADAGALANAVTALGDRAANITFNAERQAVQVMSCKGYVKYHIPVSVRQAVLLRTALAPATGWRVSAVGAIAALQR
jgi:hypothetical protein